MWACDTVLDSPEKLNSYEIDWPSEAICNRVVPFPFVNNDGEVLKLFNAAPNREGLIGVFCAFPDATFRRNVTLSSDAKLDRTFISTPRVGWIFRPDQDPVVYWKQVLRHNVFLRSEREIWRFGSVLAIAEATGVRISTTGRGSVSEAF